LVERNLAKVEVASSRLVSRSRIFKGEPVAGNCGSPFSFARSAPIDRAGRRPRRGGRVVMQRPAKPSTPVRFRPPPPIKHGVSCIARYMAAMLSVVDLEREYLGTDERLDQFIREVEFYLSAWKPKSPVTRFPYAQGHSGRVHRFDFEQDGTLIDAAKPHQGRTGFILRKATDINNAGGERKMMVVMDDRDDPEREEIETDILSTLISVLPFSRLVGGKHDISFASNIKIRPREG
jgi:hypothetical protein